MKDVWLKELKLMRSDDWLHARRLGPIGLAHFPNINFLIRKVK